MCKCAAAADGKRDRAAREYFGLKRRGVAVRWLWTDWYGVPYPLRVVLALRGVWEVRWRPSLWWKAIRWRLSRAYLPGCGCWKPGKDLWLRIRRGGGSARAA